MSALQEHLSEDTPAGGDAAAAQADSCAEAAPTADAGPSGSGGDTLVLPAIGDAPAPAPDGNPPSAGSAASRHYMDVEGTLAPVDGRLADSPYDYYGYTKVAGPLGRPRWDEP
jgi:hypothetical protein